MLKTLREPRYAAFSALMIVVALACIAAGSWQIFRFEQKRQENHELRSNAHAAAVPVDRVLPLVGSGEPVTRYGVQLRTVHATGRYDPTLQTLVRNRSVDDITGFFVLTPLRTDGGTLLVVRGFLPQPASGAVPNASAPPTGKVTITGRAEPGSSKHDAAAQLDDRQVESINPGEQAQRLDGPVYDGYVELLAGQPGTGGVRAVPAPSLGNPAGGALEPQHFAYVIQWYLFALLALAAPIVMARSEAKLRPAGDVDAGDVDAGDVGGEPVAPPLPADEADASARPVSAELTPDPEPPAEPTPEERRAAKLADRYGRSVRHR